jgi:3-oxoacyl-[acyl-carrier-protein] synthase-1/3-oxoacyl-[acyl-carrier-protein] synthase II
LIGIIAHGSVAPLPISAGEPGEEARCALGKRLGLDAEAMIERALEPILPAIDPSARIGLAIGTSSGGMASAEVLFRDLASASVEIAAAAPYFGPLRRLIRKRRFEPATLVLSACAASTIAIGLGVRWLERAACDQVIAGGFDALTVFVQAGFDVLRATTKSTPKPFALGRDGMVLAEGAGLVLLTRSPAPKKAIAYVAGFGASGDAVHLTAPDREGAGLALAAERALASAELRPDAIDLVSAHGTSTPFNDAAEARAIHRVLGRRQAPVHPFKAQIGHALGAAGVLESLVLVDAIDRGIAPAAVIHERDPDAAVPMLARAERRDVSNALKLSAAFGGANAALVLSKKPRAVLRTSRTVHVGRAVHVADVPRSETLAAALGLKPEKLGRACDLTHLALGAVAKLDRSLLEGAGIVVGHAYATMDVNYVYDARIREKGPAFAEPHRFPYTTPAAVAGEVSVAFKLTGPNIAVGAGMHGAVEALCVAADLVAAGDAERMIVVAVDAPGPAIHAVAEKNGWPVPPIGAIALVVGADASVFKERARSLASWTCSTDIGLDARIAGHAALLSLVEENPTEIAISSPQGSARVCFC